MAQLLHCMESNTMQSVEPDLIMLNDYMQHWKMKRSSYGIEEALYAVVPENI